MLALRTIFHPTDFSDRSHYALQLACALARDHGARLLIGHVRSSPAAVYGEFGTVPPEPMALDEAIREQLLAVKPTDPSIVHEHFLVLGEPAEEIVRLADEQHVDLIVMGTHGRRGLERLLMGSVAELVVRRASCPVVTVKTPIPVTVEAGAVEMAAATV